MGIFNILAVPLGYVMRLLYLAIQNYGWTIILFTLLVRVVMFPLSLKQQKSSARQAAYQPMIKEIQDKWKADRNRQSQELQKFYEENGIKMSAGCAPALINMVVLFGVIAVIQAPLNYMVQLPADEINTGIAIVQHYDPESPITAGGYKQQSFLIGEIKEDSTLFTTPVDLPYVDDQVYVLKAGEQYKDGTIVDKNGKVTQESATLKPTSMTEDDVQKVLDFKFDFLGLNLANAPSLNNWTTLIFPIMSILTLLLSQVVMMFTTPMPQGRTQMLVMTIAMGAMFGFFAFTVPAGFSLYYTASNLVMMAQQLIVKRIYDPAKIKEEVLAEIEERRAAKKAKKKVKVLSDEEEQVIEREVTESELVKLKLARARELDAKKYGTGTDDEKPIEDKAEKARKLDEKKYGVAEKAKADEAGEAPDQNADEAAEQAGEADEASESASDDAAAPKADYKPGRRKRASQKAKGEEASDDGKSFADAERAKEQKDISDEEGGQDNA